jgi:PAS domain S-box-containing protein
VAWHNNYLTDEAGQIIGTLSAGEDLTERRRAEASLDESEGRFRALVEQSLAGIYIIQDGRFRYVNPGFAVIFGYESAAALIDRVPVADLVAPGDRQRVADNIRKRVDGEAADLHYGFRGLRRDGSQIDVEVHGRRFDYQGRPAVIGLVLDITARQAAEDSLRASELRFHDIVNASADWVWEVNAEGRYTYVSDSIVDLLGYTPGEVLGRTPFDLMPPEEAEQVRGQFAEIASRGLHFRDLDNINRHKDGSLRHVQTNGMPVFDAAGNLLGYRGLDRDVTERRRAELALLETSNRLRALVRTIPDLVWLKDPQGVYLASNPRFEDFFGAREAEILGKTDYDFVGRDLADFFRARDQAAIAAGKPSINEEEVPFASDGHREVLQTIKTPIYGSEGELIGVLGIGRDITARKRAEEALQRQADELKARNEQLERFNRAMVGRELDMIELKRQVNDLCRQLGRVPPFDLGFVDDPGAAAGSEERP